MLWSCLRTSSSLFDDVYARVVMNDIVSNELQYQQGAGGTEIEMIIVFLLLVNEQCSLLILCRRKTPFIVLMLYL